LFENRSFSKTLAYLALKFSNFGHVLLSTLETSGNYPSSTFKPSLKDSNSNLNFGHKDPSLDFLSFFLLFLQADQEEEEDQLGDLLSVTKGSGRDLFPLSYSVGIEGKEEPEANDLSPALLNLSLSLISPSHHHQPPIDAHHPVGTLP
jgi:hypothetical protein